MIPKPDRPFSDLESSTNSDSLGASARVNRYGSMGVGVRCDRGPDNALVMSEIGD